MNFRKNIYLMFLCVLFSYTSIQADIRLDSIARNSFIPAMGSNIVENYYPLNTDVALNFYGSGFTEVQTIHFETDELFSDKYTFGFDGSQYGSDTLFAVTIPRGSIKSDGKFNVYLSGKDSSGKSVESNTINIYFFDAPKITVPTFPFKYDRNTGYYATAYTLGQNFYEVIDFKFSANRPNGSQNFLNGNLTVTNKEIDMNIGTAVPVVYGVYQSVTVTVTTSAGTATRTGTIDAGDGDAGSSLVVVPRFVFSNAGQKVAITGSNFNAISQVLFNSVPVNFTILSDNSIEAISPGFTEIAKKVVVSFVTQQGMLLYNPNNYFYAFNRNLLKNK